MRRYERLCDHSADGTAPSYMLPWMPDFYPDDYICVRICAEVYSLINVYGQRFLLLIKSDSEQIISYVENDRDFGRAKAILQVGICRTKTMQRSEVLPAIFVHLFGVYRGHTIVPLRNTSGENHQLTILSAAGEPSRFTTSWR